MTKSGAEVQRLQENVDDASLVDRLQRAETLLARLADESAIRDVVSRYGRAIDRLDAGLLATLFHSDADVHYGPDVFEGSAADYVPKVMAIAASMRRSQHMMGHSVIEIEGDVAWVETYAQAIQLLERDGKLVEFGTGSRLLDRFERRAGQWRIAHRQVVVDWLNQFVADETLFQILRGPPQSQHGRSDPLYQFRNT